MIRGVWSRSRLTPTGTGSDRTLLGSGPCLRRRVLESDRRVHRPLSELGLVELGDETDDDECRHAGLVDGDRHPDLPVTHRDDVQRPQEEGFARALGGASSFIESPPPPFIVVRRQPERLCSAFVYGC